MVDEAEKHAQEDKERFERIEAKNQLEGYLYNARNSVTEDKVKETLGASGVEEVEQIVKDGLQWLEENQEAFKEEYQEKQKQYEERIRPILMKLYQNAGGPGSSSMPTTEESYSSGPGPKIEEVD
jgi:L1 cell adhesion molecule like protein